MTIVGTFAFTNNDVKIADTYDQYDVSIASKASEFKHDHSRLHSTTDQHQANDHVHHGGECHSDICCVGEYLTQIGLVVLVEAVGQENCNMDTDIHRSRAPLTPDRPQQIA
jgi:hypothetical protein